ncbi:type 1 glutamine amidotransferase [Nocardioides rubriscoriae]|uniref:type 1 glutamine amidotransferase n=1 Tax=Nocardioides rubriscoriae TaxID=642762 RepID=UPI0011E06309|nr:type 1 glutamine amidotransferase [Nocardioides rubriscoriae]
MPAPLVLVVQHQDSCPPALLGEWLVEAGCVLEVVRPYAGDSLPAPDDLTAYQGLVVLGGSMDAWDPDVAWLMPVRRLVLEAAALAVPTLGVCLGHQLCALAFGGDVGRSPHGQQVGLGWVRWTDEAEHDDLVAPGGPHPLPQPGIFWNDDVVLRDPPGAFALARTKDGDVQAMRFGPTTWGVQWHPEATPEILAAWAASDAERHRARGIDQQARLAEVAAAATGLERVGRELADRFAARAQDLAAQRPGELG